jgi:hypothetical protein
MCSGSVASVELCKSVTLTSVTAVLLPIVHDVSATLASTSQATAPPDTAVLCRSILLLSSVTVVEVCDTEPDLPATNRAPPLAIAALLCSTHPVIVAEVPCCHAMFAAYKSQCNACMHASAFLQYKLYGL